MLDSFSPNIKAIGSPTTVPMTQRPSATPAAIITIFLQGPSLDLPIFGGLPELFRENEQVFSLYSCLLLLTFEAS